MTSKSRISEEARRMRVQRQGFRTGEYIVYPAHGVGQIIDYQEQEVVGHKLELFFIFFAKDNMTIKVPIDKIKSVGMRKLANETVVRRTLKVLQEKKKRSRKMWSKRAAEYESKIKSGDIIMAAEVVGELYRGEMDAQASYSEKILYDSAVDTLTGEISAIKKITESEAKLLIDANLAKQNNAKAT